MNEIFIGIAGWTRDLQRARDALWNASTNVTIDLVDNTLEDIVKFERLMHDLSDLALNYKEIAFNDVLKMQEVGGNIAESDEMMSRMFGGGN